jgi:superfamily II DNA or RNA helicase
METRRFALNQRRALYAVAGGRCEDCGNELVPGWHADHRQPWSTGGQTDVLNGQALCPACNLKKGSGEMIEFEGLRPWQKRFVKLYRVWTQQVFSLVVLPGGGKTVAALFAANEWQREAVKPRLIVFVVPTRYLCKQVQKSAKRDFNLEMQTTEFDGSIKPGMNGLVMTYAGLDNNSEVLRTLSARYDVLAVLDEFHHLGESASWGISAKNAFENASRILAMSGTPWRSDAGRIPFLPIDDQTGEYVIHSKFDWPLALEEHPRIIRDLAFRPFHGSANFLEKRTGKTLSLNSREILSDDEESRCLKGRLRESLYQGDILKEAYTRLMRVRQSKPDAACLVVCMDIDHAEKVAKRWEQVTGEMPTLAHSDWDRMEGSARQRDPIETFKQSTDKCIVSVRQVSEGVDIPRLMIGVYLTNYVTELYFRQFVGRIARHQGTDVDEEAYVFMPHHSKLTLFADKITELQALALQRRQEAEADLQPDPADTVSPSNAGEGGFEYLGGSNAERAGLILPRVLNADASMERKISAFAAEFGVRETAAAQIMRKHGMLQEPHVPSWVNTNATLEKQSQDENEEPLEERLKRQRLYQGKLIKKLAYRTGVPHSELNFQANQHCGCASVTAATEEQLANRLAYIHSLFGG